MSRRSVRTDTPSRSASSAPGQYRWVCSNDSSRSVRELVFAMFFRFPRIEVRKWHLRAIT